MKHTSRRFNTKTLIISITLGMITTVLFAWGNTFTWWDWNNTRVETEGIYTISHGNHRFIETASEKGTTWYRSYPRKEWRHFCIGDNTDSITFGRGQPLISPPIWVTDRISSNYPVVTVCARGLPARAFVSVAYGNISIPDRWSDFEMSRNYSSESIDFTIGSTEFVLPTSILWRGLLFNILFWSCIWYFALPRLQRPKELIRARIEHKRTQLGLCPKCKYDLQYRQSAGCPECGWNRSEQT